MPPFERLQNASKEDLLKIIHSTKIKMGRLRKKMEHPDYRNKTEIVSPSDEVIYKCDRDFLNRAIIKYISLGGDYKWSITEKKDTEFNDRLDVISKIVFYNGGFFSSNFKTVIDLSEDKPKLFAGSFSEVYEQDIEIDKEEFLYQLGELHIGEWRCSYSPNRFGMEVLDGEQWVLKFEYKDGKKKTFNGNNAYPYNFDELLDVLMLNENQLSVE